MIDYDELIRRFADRSTDYAEASPFPHAVLENVLSTEVLQRVASEFPSPEAMEQHFAGPFEKKWAESRWECFGPATRAVAAELNSNAFLRALEALTGIERLIADVSFYGGGMHQISPGGLLGVHADYNLHRVNGLRRRLNVLLYLNEDWDAAWGGQLELWDEAVQRPVRKIEPTLGRMVVFSTTSEAFHGHPDPLACPPERTRKSLAFYYFTNDADAEDVAARHSTVFRARPGSARDRRQDIGRRVIRWIPPALTEAVVSRRSSRRS
ncbi:MAG: 2OG-Fe(II) oxygenase [Acidimicrobiia bacterium]